ncbi:MAG: ATP-binding protein [Anaerovoracaceae bacterium]
MKKKLAELNLKLKGLTIFRELTATPVILKLQILLDALENKDEDDQVEAYGAFVSALYPETSNFSLYIKSFLLNNDNFYVKQRAAGSLLSPLVENCLMEEVAVLQDLSKLTSSDVKSVIRYKGFLPDWENTLFDFKYDYHERIGNLPHTGYGIYAKYSTFTLKDGQIIPVKYPDPQSVDQLFGYQRERDLIIKNTQALISGQGASNMLLYGDAGTGKSSSIKAVANFYAKDGLRLVEVKKNTLYQIPDVIDELSANPLKFILFIDDLSFSSNDDNFSALKAILEGSVSTGGKNIAIYATSNRRHLVKETMGERDGNELHLSDTLQETMSLAARFGLTITYQRPERDEYLSIVKHLAVEYGLALGEDELFRKAEAHAIRHNGRSPRTAKQFVELQKIGI